MVKYTAYIDVFRRVRMFHLGNYCSASLILNVKQFYFSVSLFLFKPPEHGVIYMHTVKLSIISLGVLFA